MNKIDNLDKKIILQLFENARQSNIQIAKNIYSSKEVVSYRIKNLIKKEIIQKIIPLIDFSKLGFSIYRLQIKLNPISEEEKKKFIKYVENIQNINWVDEIVGKWHIVILFYIKNSNEFNFIYEKLIEDFGYLIDEKEFSIISSIYYYPPNYLCESKRFEIVTGKFYDHIEIEDNAKLIIKELFINGRISYIDLASKLNVSISTIKYHMKYLKDKSILVGFQPILNINKLGYEHFKVVLNISNPKERILLEKELKINPNIVHITNSIGNYDFEFECEFEKVQELLNLLENIKKRIKLKEYEIIYNNEEFLINELSLKMLE